MNDPIFKDKATKAEIAEREKEARDSVLELLGDGDGRLHITMMHRSRDGMSRRMRCHILRDSTAHDITAAAARILGWRFNANHHELVVGGCGMDMLFHTAYSLSQALFGVKNGNELSQGNEKDKTHLNYSRVI